MGLKGEQSKKSFAQDSKKRNNYFWIGLGLLMQGSSSEIKIGSYFAFIALFTAFLQQYDGILILILVVLLF